MTTLISLLGKVPRDSSNGGKYRTARYMFDNAFQPEVSFFGMALREYLRADRFILAGTAGSMWDVFFEHEQSDDAAVLELIDAVEKENVTPAMLTLHEKFLSNKLGIPVRCLLIPYAQDDAEQATILHQLADCLEPGEEVVLDVTHGFRHLPMLALVAARYLTHVQQVRVSEVYYGALQMTDRDTNKTPVLRLGGMLKMLDWVEALAAYGASGDYGVFAKPLQDDGMSDENVAQLKRGSFFERNNNPLDAKSALSGALGPVQDHDGALGGLFRNALEEQISWFKRGDGNRGTWELVLAKRYLERKDYLRAVIFMYESMRSNAVWKQGASSADHGAREEAFQAERSTFDKKTKDDSYLLDYLRNAMAHGVRSGKADLPARAKRTADEVTRLLKDEEALGKRLRELQGRLFG